MLLEKLNYFLIQCTKTSPKQVKDLNTRLETIKLTEETISIWDWAQQYFFFFRICLLGQSYFKKAKINKNYIKLKAFTQWKKPSTKQKGHLLKRRRYLKQYVWWGANIQTIPRNHTPQHQKKNKQLNIKNWAEDLNRNFSRNDTQMANRHMKRSPTSLLLEMLIKTTIKYHLTHVRMLIIKNTTNNKS